MPAGVGYNSPLTDAQAFSLFNDVKAGKRQFGEVQSLFEQGLLTEDALKPSTLNLLSQLVPKAQPQQKVSGNGPTNEQIMNALLGKGGAFIAPQYRQQALQQLPLMERGQTRQAMTGQIEQAVAQQLLGGMMGGMIPQAPGGVPEATFRFGVPRR